MNAEPLSALEREREVAKLSAQVCLPLRSRAWRGGAGGWQGMDQGSSIDFQDHRMYMMGDDPRHLDWAAYARTNHYMMKTFRAEVSPRIDVALDISPSMKLTAAKESRVLDLLALLLGCALRDNLTVRVYTLDGGGSVRRLDPQSIPRMTTLPDGSSHSRGTSNGLPLEAIPWQGGSLRLLISDLLFTSAPEVSLRPLVSNQARGIIFCPFLREEETPEWAGNLEMHDCETRLVRQQRVEAGLLSRYQKSYQRHFELWREAALKRRIPLARVSCELALNEVVRNQILPTGALEVRH